MKTLTSAGLAIDFCIYQLIRDVIGKGAIYSLNAELLYFLNEFYKENLQKYDITETV